MQHWCHLLHREQKPISEILERKLYVPHVIFAFIQVQLADWMRDGMSHLYHWYKLLFDIYVSGRKQTRSTCVGVLVVCIKEDLSLPMCIFCKDIMPLFSIHKEGSGYPA